MKITDAALSPFYIEYDGLQYTLREKCVTGLYKLEKGIKVKTKNPGKEYEETHGYFSKITNAINKCIKLKIERDNEEMNLWEYFNACKRAAEEVTGILDSIESQSTV